ncbi:MAG TPA: hypothetical protein VGR12_00260 [Solirubrobacteraceae bacterium]|nr:hypothetical protein [Solirubrobacteraceae bacterium]
MLMLARLVRFITAAVVVVIVLGIVLHVLDANAGNAFVSTVHDIAGWLVTPFKGLFSFGDNDLQVAVNWGIAALVYGIVGGFLSRMLARAALGRSARRGSRRGRDVAY